MATWFPASLAAEFVLLTLVFFLWGGRLPSRMLAVGAVAIQIPLWLGKQIFWNLDTGGTIGFFYPIGIVTTVPFIFVLFTYVALVNLFEMFGRDMLGKKIKE